MLLVGFFTSASAQNQFNTPFFWLSEAKFALDKGDTISAKAAIEKSVSANLFDVAAVLSNKKLSGLLHGEFGRHVLSGIHENRRKLQDPESLEVITSDIDLFWNSFDSGAISAQDLNSEYIAKGSPGLQTFFQVRMRNNTDNLSKALSDKKSFYASIRKASIGMKDLKPEFVRAAKSLKALYPEAVFPPVYFLMGSLNNVGTPDGLGGMLIGTEHLCLTPQTDLSALSDFEKTIVFDKSLVVPIVLHEYVHMQQKNAPEETLLDYAIMEGVADFITYRITSRYTNPDVFAYGFEHEAAIWEKFRSEMNGDNLDSWLFNSKDEKTGVPANLAYFVGFRICEAYYGKASDKKTAISDLMEIRDFKKILESSGYNGKRS